MPLEALLRLCHVTPSDALIDKFIAMQCSRLGDVTSDGRSKHPVIDMPGVTITIRATIEAPTAVNLRQRFLPALVHVAYWTLRKNKHTVLKSQQQTVKPLSQKQLQALQQDSTINLDLQLVDPRDCMQLALNYELLKVGLEFQFNNLKTPWDLRSNFSTGEQLPNSITLALFSAGYWEWLTEQVFNRQNLLTTCLYYMAAARLIISLPAQDLIKQLLPQIVYPSLARCHKQLSQAYKNVNYVSEVEAVLLFRFLQSEATGLGCYLYPLEQLFYLCEPYLTGKELVSTYLQLLNHNIDNLSYVCRYVKILLDKYYANEANLQQYLLEHGAGIAAVDNYILIYCQNLLLKYKRSRTVTGEVTLMQIKAMSQQHPIPWRVKFLMAVCYQYGINCQANEVLADSYYTNLQLQLSRFDYYIIDLNRLTIFSRQHWLTYQNPALNDCLTILSSFWGSYIVLQSNNSPVAFEATTTRLKYLLDSILKIAQQATNPNVRFKIVDYLLVACNLPLHSLIEAKHVTFILDLIALDSCALSQKMAYCLAMLKATLTAAHAKRLNTMLIQISYTVENNQDRKAFGKFLNDIINNTAYEAKLKLRDNFDKAILENATRELLQSSDGAATAIQACGLMNDKPRHRRRSKTSASTPSFSFSKAT